VFMGYFLLASCLTIAVIGYMYGLYSATMEPKQSAALAASNWVLCFAFAYALFLNAMDVIHCGGITDASHKRIQDINTRSHVSLEYNLAMGSRSTQQLPSLNQICAKSAETVPSLGCDSTSEAADFMCTKQLAIFKAFKLNEKAKERDLRRKGKKDNYAMYQKYIEDAYNKDQERRREARPQNRGQNRTEDGDDPNETPKRTRKTWHRGRHIRRALEPVKWEKETAIELDKKSIRVNWESMAPLKDIAVTKCIRRWDENSTNRDLVKVK